METTLKNLLIKTTIGCMVVLALASIFYVKSFMRQTDPNASRSFGVTAEGKVSATPNIAQFTFSVISEGGTNIAELQQNNTKKMNEAIAFVKSKGVEEKDIQTQQYNLTPRYEYPFCLPRGVCPPPRIGGYSITQGALVKVRKFEILGDLVAGVVTQGANNVSGVEFTIENPDALEAQARAEAIIKAKEKAVATAKAAGFRLGRLVFIDDVSPPSYYGIGGETKMYAGDAGATPPPPTFEPGAKEVKVTAVVRYEIK